MKGITAWLNVKIAWNTVLLSVIRLYYHYVWLLLIYNVQIDLGPFLVSLNSLHHNGFLEYVILKSVLWQKKEKRYIELICTTANLNFLRFKCINVL